MFFYLLQIMLHQSVVTVYGLYLYCARTISNYCVKFNCMRESHKYYRQQPRGSRSSIRVKILKIALQLLDQGQALPHLQQLQSLSRLLQLTQSAWKCLSTGQRLSFIYIGYQPELPHALRGHSKEATARKPGTEVEAQGHDQLTLRLSKGSRCQGLCK